MAFGESHICLTNGYDIYIYIYIHTPFCKLTWMWKTQGFSRKMIYKCWVFHIYVSLQKGVFVFVHDRHKSKFSSLQMIFHHLWLVLTKTKRPICDRYCRAKRRPWPTSASMSASSPPCVRCDTTDWINGFVGVGNRLGKPHIFSLWSYTNNSG